MSPAQDHAVPRPGSSLHFALWSAGSRRAALTAWARWWHEVSQIPYTVSEPAVAERKLAWWAQAVTDAFAHQPQHPLLKALHEGGASAQAQNLPPLPLWLEQIEGLQTLTQQTRWLDEATLRRHMDRTTGAACEGAARLAGARTPSAWAAARAIGVGLRRGHILARLGQDAQAGWLHLPIDVLQQHGVKAHELLRPVAAQPDETIRQLLAHWGQGAWKELDEAVKAARRLPRPERRALTPLVVLARLQQTLLKDLEAANYPVLRQRVVLGPLRKAWTAWRTRWLWAW